MGAEEKVCHGNASFVVKRNGRTAMARLNKDRSQVTINFWGPNAPGEVKYSAAFGVATLTIETIVHAQLMARTWVNDVPVAEKTEKPAAVVEAEVRPVRPDQALYFTTYAPCEYVGNNGREFCVEPSGSLFSRVLVNEDWTTAELKLFRGTTPVVTRTFRLTPIAGLVPGAVMINNVTRRARQWAYGKAKGSRQQRIRSPRRRVGREAMFVERQLGRLAVAS